MESSCYIALRRMTRSRQPERAGRGSRYRYVSSPVRGDGARRMGRHIPHNQVAGTRCDKVSSAPDTYACTYFVCVPGPPNRIRRYCVTYADPRRRRLSLKRLRILHRKLLPNNAHVAHVRLISLTEETARS